MACLFSILQNFTGFFNINFRFDINSVQHSDVALLNGYSVEIFGITSILFKVFGLFAKNKSKIPVVGFGFSWEREKSAVMFESAKVLCLQILYEQIGIMKIIFFQDPQFQ